MVKVEISLEAFQPTIINIFIQISTPSALSWSHSMAFRGIKLDYMNLVPTITIKPHEIMPVFLYYY